MKSVWIIPVMFLMTGCSGIEQITTVLSEGLTMVIMASLIIGIVMVIYCSFSFLLPRKKPSISTVN